ncbi:hypothetical protein Goklo_006490, partial [Gossypium klotzschianum]|nr:hypothetical protein [Gossypium klotzschianum]
MTVGYRYHRWERFWTIPNDNVVVPAVQEFYASLWDQFFSNTEGHIWDIVRVRGKEMRVTSRIISDFYNASSYEKYVIDETDLEYFWDITNFLTEGRGEWK